MPDFNTPEPFIPGIFSTCAGCRCTGAVGPHTHHARGSSCAACRMVWENFPAGTYVELPPSPLRSSPELKWRPAAQLLRFSEAGFPDEGVLFLFRGTEEKFPPFLAEVHSGRSKVLCRMVPDRDFFPLVEHCSVPNYEVAPVDSRFAPLNWPGE